MVHVYSLRLIKLHAVRGHVNEEETHTVLTISINHIQKMIAQLIYCMGIS